ncbi:hypothetical protein [Pseudomonas abietaniphila]
MDFERTRHVGHYGVVFTLIHFTVGPGDAASLRTLKLPEISKGSYEVTRLLEETYDRMLAQGRPCRMVLAVSDRLSRKTADLLNDQRVRVGGVVSSLSGKAVSEVFGPLVGGMAGMFSGGKARQGFPTYHVGDVIVSIDAQVAGGMGPQRSSSALLLKNNGDG